LAKVARIALVYAEINETAKALEKLPQRNPILGVKANRGARDNDINMRLK
jgi:hypothetical protein